jgi:hypothetical protein
VNPVRFTLTVYAPLSFVAIPNHPHDLPTGEYHKRLPKFAGNYGVSVEDHLTDFLKVVDDCEVEYEDVVMRMFVQTLEGDARIWYKSLPDASIDGWDSFQEKFTERWVDKHDNSFLLKAFSNIKRNENETVPEFNTRFSKTDLMMLWLCYTILRHMMEFLVFCSGRKIFTIWRRPKLLLSS